MVTDKLLDAARNVSLMATSRRTDLEQGSRSFGEKPLLFNATRRNAYKAFSKNLSSPKAFLIGAFILCTYTITSSHRATGEDGLESLVPHGRSAFGIRDPIDLSTATTLVIYDYQGLDEEDADNLRFFLALGVSPDDGNRYMIVSNEQLVPQQQGEDGMILPIDDSLLGPEQIPLPPFESLPPNVEIVLRPNVPCRSAGGVLGWLMESNSIDTNGYKNFILLDSSVRGPFLPSHWPPLVHWSASLLARLQGSVRMAGATISTDPTQPGPDAPPEAQPRPQPRIRSGVVAFDQAALAAIRKDPDVLKCRGNAEDALWYNEAGASAAVLYSGLNIDCLMLRFQNKDWLDKSSWGWKER